MGVVKYRESHLMQLFSVGSVASVQTGGVASPTHVGGFIFGAVFARLFEDPQRMAQQSLD